TILKDLVTFNAQQRNKSLKESYNEFFDSKILKYYKDNLEKTNKEFAFTLQEYKDGLLLFDVLQDKVWKRADTDTIGLKSFFEKNSTNYQWPKRGDVILASCTKNEKAKLVKKYLEEDKGIDEIKKLVNEGATIHVIFTSGILEENHKKLPKGFIFDEERVSDVFDLGDNNFTVVKVKQIIPPKPMLFKEARGRVVNDFQEYLEQQWIDDLRQRYTVKVHQKVLKRLLKQNLN
ncbi:MAG: peptidylprolyl isomerase, partial [Aureibaculum sp.]